MKPATEPPLPANVPSNDELYTIGQHLEQYRHATRSSADYWREALRRDPGDSRCNNALGMWHLKRGEFEEARALFLKSIERAISRNPNPYDGEPYYNLGLACRFLGSDSQAFDAFAKAAWNAAWQAASHHALGEMACKRGDWPLALHHLDKAIRKDQDNLRARNLRMIVLRKLGRDSGDGAPAVAGTVPLLAGESTEGAFRGSWGRGSSGEPKLGATENARPLSAAREVGERSEPGERDLPFELQKSAKLASEGADSSETEEVLRLDPLDPWARHLNGDPIRADNGVKIDIAIDLLRAGLYSEALEILALADDRAIDGTAPMIGYYRAHALKQLGQDPAEVYAKAAAASPDYCFPARLEDIEVLRWAPEEDSRAAYYLGNLLYDRRRYAEAIEQWEKAVRLATATSGNTAALPLPPEGGVDERSEVAEGHIRELEPRWAAKARPLSAAREVGERSEPGERDLRCIHAKSPRDVFDPRAPAKESNASQREGTAAAPPLPSEGEVGDRREPGEGDQTVRATNPPDPALPIALRNLGIAAFNVQADAAKARAYYDRAIEAAPDDARLWYERDQLWKRVGVPPCERLARLQERPDLVLRRDDLTLEYCSLLNETGEFAEAERILDSRRFQPWEGGESMVLRVFTQAELGLGHQALSHGDAAKAKHHFYRAAFPPENLGEARHLLANASDLWLACGDAAQALGEGEEAQKWWRKAAEFKGDFQEMAVQPYSELTCYQVLALHRLGRTEEAERQRLNLKHYAEQLLVSPAKIDYFATSLPTVPLFEDHLQARQESKARLILSQVASLARGTQSRPSDDTVDG